MWIPILILIGGLVILVAGAEALVRGASGIARSAGMSPLVIGLTIVAFGTSSPELAVSIHASTSGSGGIVLGNIVGSNIFNITVILGIAAIVCPLKVHLQIIRLDLPLMLAATCVFMILVRTGGFLLRWEAALLAFAAIGYTLLTVFLSRRESNLVDVVLPEIPREKPRHPLFSVLLSLGGLGLLVLGANLMVENAVFIARRWGVEEALIGLTIIAAGTSLPELATSVVAALRKETDVAIGNIVGSNLFNLLAIGGISGLIHPVSGNGMTWVDLGFMAATSVLLLPLMKSGFRIVRWEGVLLLAGYGLYLFVRWP